jgi:hypothetical protein
MLWKYVCIQNIFRALIVAISFQRKRISDCRGWSCVIPLRTVTIYIVVARRTSRVLLYIYLVVITQKEGKGSKLAAGLMNDRLPVRSSTIGWMDGWGWIDWVSGCQCVLCRRLEGDKLQQQIDRIKLTIRSDEAKIMLVELVCD